MAEQCRSPLRALLLFGFALAFLSIVGANPNLSIYQARDIHRAMDLLRGHWIWYGSDLSGGGHTPGPFYYWLISLPLALTGTWQSVLWLGLILESAAAVGFWHFGVRHFNSQTGLAGYFLFLLSGFFWINLSDFWNPSFTPFFTILAIILLYENPLERNKLRFVLGSVILGLAIQIHYNQLLVLMGALGGICLAPRLGPREKLRNAASMLGLALLPAVPFILWMVNGAHLGESGHSPVSGVSTFLRTASAGESKGLAPFFKILSVSEIVLLPVVAGWCWAIYSQCFQGKTVIPRSRFLWGCLLISALPFFSIGYGAYFSRYLMPFFIVLYLLSAPLVARFFVQFEWVLIVPLASFGVAALAGGPRSHVETLFCIRNMLLLGFAGAAISWVPKDRKERSVTAAFVFFAACVAQLCLLEFSDGHFIPFPESFADRGALVTMLARETGWTYDQFRERTYVVGRDPEDDFSLLYEEASRANGPLQASRTGPDGILIVRSDFPRFLKPFCGPQQPNWRGFKQQLPPEIFRAAIRGDIRCDSTLASGPFDICLYNFSWNATHSTWNNLGYPYRYKQPPLFALDGPTGVHRVDSKTGILFVNACPNLEATCTVYFRLRFAGKDGIDVTAFGDPIAVPDAAPNPSWAVALENTEVQETCDGKTVSHSLASHLGVPSSKASPFLLAPYETRIPLDCAAPTLVSVAGRNGVSTFNNYFPEALKPFRIEWRP